MGLGADIAAARTAAGISIEELAAATRVRVGILRAMESDDYAICGGDVYARGHIRAIARVLRADAEVWVNQFDTHYADAPITVAQVFDAERRTSGRQRISTTNVTVLISVVLALAVGAAAVMIGRDDRPSDDLAVLLTPTPSASSSASASDDPVEPLDASTGALASADGVVVEMSFSGSSWVRVTDAAGRVTYEGTLRAGDARTFRDDDALSLVLGNGAAVRLVVNGEDVGVAGGPGQVIRRTYSAPN